MYPTQPRFLAAEHVEELLLNLPLFSSPISFVLCEIGTSTICSSPTARVLVGPTSPSQRSLPEIEASPQCARRFAVALSHADQPRHLDSLFRRLRHWHIDSPLLSSFRWGWSHLDAVALVPVRPTLPPRLSLSETEALVHARRSAVALVPVGTTPPLLPRTQRLPPSAEEQGRPLSAPRHVRALAPEAQAALHESSTARKAKAFQSPVDNCEAMKMPSTLSVHTIVRWAFTCWR